MSEAKIVIGAIVRSAYANWFRRAGMTFTKEPRRVDLSELSPGQLDFLLSSAKNELVIEPIEGTAAERDALEKRRAVRVPVRDGELRVPHANVKAFACTAQRVRFRRLGTDFPVNKEIVIPAEGLSQEKRTFLLNSDPADLIVREVLDEPASPAPEKARR